MEGIEDSVNPYGSDQNELENASDVSNMSNAMRIDGYNTDETFAEVVGRIPAGSKYVLATAAVAAALGYSMFVPHSASAYPGNGSEVVGSSLPNTSAEASVSIPVAEVIDDSETYGPNQSKHPPGTLVWTLYHRDRPFVGSPAILTPGGKWYLLGEGGRAGLVIALDCEGRRARWVYKDAPGKLFDGYICVGGRLVTVFIREKDIYDIRLNKPRGF